MEGVKRSVSTVIGLCEFVDAYLWLDWEAVELSPWCLMVLSQRKPFGGEILMEPKNLHMRCPVMYKPQCLKM